MPQRSDKFTIIQKKIFNIYGVVNKKEKMFAGREMFVCRFDVEQ